MGYPLAPNNWLCSTAGKSLAAYIVLKSGLKANAADLLADVGQYLPAHACPSRILFLSELPLNPNGKVNRSALPEPPQSPVTNDGVNSPTNEIEEKLIQLWCQILEVPALGTDDNFFLVGGESLRATRLISRINAAFHCQLSLPRLFEAPTVRQMARLVEKSRDTGQPFISNRPKSQTAELPDVSTMSEQEVDALLSQLLADDDSPKR